MRKKSLKISGIVLFAFMLIGNLQFAMDSYGSSKASLGSFVKAQATSSTGGETAGDTGGDTGGYPQKCSSCPPVQNEICDTCDMLYFRHYCCREGAYYQCSGHAPC
jgi:hypothetical protein